MTPRPGVDQAFRFFNECTDCSEWEEVLKKYDLALQLVATKKKSDQLVALDTFWRHEYAQQVQKQGHFDLQALSKVMKWKLTRGKMRPLQKLCDSNAPAAVISASTKAMQCLSKGDWKGAMAALTTLKAIGEATASALLAPLAPTICPFMADEALEVTCGGREYTAKAFAIMREQLIQKAQALLDPAWTAEMVGRVIWIVAILSSHGQFSFSAGSTVPKTTSTSSSSSSSTSSTSSSSSSSSSSSKKPKSSPLNGTTTTSVTTIHSDKNEDVDDNTVATTKSITSSSKSTKKRSREQDTIIDSRSVRGKSEEKHDDEASVPSERKIKQRRSEIKNECRGN